jgi:hypothetical protein
MGEVRVADYWPIIVSIIVPIILANYRLIGFSYSGAAKPVDYFLSIKKVNFITNPITLYVSIC